MNNEETILVPLNLSNSWQSIRPSYPKISIYITSGITIQAFLAAPPTLAAAAATLCVHAARTTPPCRHG